MIIVSSIFRRYEIVLERPDEPVRRMRLPVDLPSLTDMSVRDKGRLFEEAAKMLCGDEETFNLIGPIAGSLLFPIKSSRRLYIYSTPVP